MEEDILHPIRDEFKNTAHDPGEKLSNDAMSRSRRVSSNQSKETKGFLIYGLGIVAVLLIVGFTGFQLLVNYSLLLDKFRGEDNSVSQTAKSADFISAPSFDIPYSATTSSSLNFTGKAENESEVELFLNNKLVETERVKNASFQFRKIKLEDGTNSIKIRAKKGKMKSSFSESVPIAYREKEPKLEINNPRNGDSFSGGQSILKVSGKTESYAKVTINGTWAIMDDEGNFKYDYLMQSGENILRIVSEDDVKNKVEQEVKFNYSP